MHFHISTADFQLLLAFGRKTLLRLSSSTLRRKTFWIQKLDTIGLYSRNVLQALEFAMFFDVFDTFQLRN